MLAVGPLHATTTMRTTTTTQQQRRRLRRLRRLRRRRRQPRGSVSILDQAHVQLTERIAMVEADAAHAAQFGNPMEPEAMSQQAPASEAQQPSPAAPRLRCVDGFTPGTVRLVLEGSNRAPGWSPTGAWLGPLPAPAPESPQPSSAQFGSPAQFLSLQASIDRTWMPEYEARLKEAMAATAARETLRDERADSHLWRWKKVFQDESGHAAWQRIPVLSRQTLRDKGWEPYDWGCVAAWKRNPYWPY